MNRMQLALAALTFALLPATAGAVKLVCQGGYQVVQCNDGTIFTCTAGGQQIDCYDDATNMAAYAQGCAEHGGLAGLVNSMECSADFEDDVVHGDDGEPIEEIIPIRRR
ncbi:MAG: hypothetical protein H6702_11650 [Myxococcales bacterium]|nr:hypothetical protein [Myxococcales bacterium]